MTEGAAKGHSDSSEASECGGVQRESRRPRSGLNWSELLLPENGGPGESPGRERSVAMATAASKARYARQGGIKRARGTSKAKAQKTVSRDQERKAGW